MPRLESVVTPRFLLTFLGIYGVMLFAEWFRFVRGFNTQLWNGSSWLLMVGVLVAEAVAAAVMAAAVDRALPSTGYRPAVRKSRRRRSSRGVRSSSRA
jgi:hypothetical protein